MDDKKQRKNAAQRAARAKNLLEARAYEANQRKNRTPEQKQKQLDYTKAYNAKIREDPELVEQRRLNRKAWRDKNRAACSRYYKMKYAENMGLAFDLPLEFFENMPSHCPQCGVEFLPPRSKRDRVASLDRNNPVLGYVMGNCEWLCMLCNRRKQDQSWADLLAFAQRGFDRTRPPDAEWHLEPEEMKF